ncbi:polysaccharide biosynthesis/export family protein [Marinobacterium sediminicola]|uniref:Polysaccharide export outer membrane protein n=1 Tax=Marinobacterium sediminicola TaxID=518898 RepID=A0ABY1S0P3_9GAMM|nr:polysaccharide biosynthesis/export family protein [Marinobacterium sediminicola]ULG68373.1 polysaccharide export protein [Marinobacterium sediminicola]SMR74748.1 polysaccharide export outer membrane protein [Marinobacterium sediminicola]
MIQRLLAPVLLILSFLLPAGHVWAAGDSQYKLGSGDVIRINVFGEEDLSFDQIRMTDAGTFSYPFLGEVRALGKTVAELENIITRGLKGDYLIDPRVSVSIIEYRDFFVNGEVKNPGGYPFKPGLTLRKAVALAGGLTERASESKMSVIREVGRDKQTFKATMDTPIQPGDIITIEQSFF